MKKDYLCPKCKSKLCVDNYVVLTVKKLTGEGGVVFLSPELGDYSHVKNASLNFEEGEKVDVFCPVCNENLISVHEQNLAKLFLEDDESGKYISILFSVIFGEKATYKIKKEGKVETFGKNALPSVDIENLISMI